MSAEARAPWLVPFTLAEGETATFRIGSFALRVDRRAREWRVQTATTTDLTAVDVEVRCPDPEPRALTFTNDARFIRFAFDGGQAGLHLRPRLADRAVVVRPADPLFLLPGTTVEVFVSTILWIALEAEPTGVVLIDVPALRPSDTWFGPSTREGELAYLSRTSARLDVHDLPARPHRATTCIRIVNVGHKACSLARVLLPAPSLELWRLPTGGLWTQTVELKVGDTDETPLRILPGPPDVSLLGGDTDEVQAPADVGQAPTALVASSRRVTPQKNLLMRAMQAIF